VRVGVLASGGGSILEAMLERGLPVVAVVVDRPCGATDIAARAGLTATVVERDDFGPTFDRAEYSKRVVAALDEAEVDLVAMAGFGTILDGLVFDSYAGRVLNTHPALLPSFPGWHGVEDALAYGVKVTGCTVHVATAEVDAGPIVAQQAVAVEPGDTVETLHERIKVVERSLYPRTIRSFAKERVG
jgi:phosphoribosylglycinamide formyltransferase-1